MSVRTKELESMLNREFLPYKKILSGYSLFNEQVCLTKNFWDMIELHEPDGQIKGTNVTALVKMPDTLWERAISKITKEYGVFVVKGKDIVQNYNIDPKKTYFLRRIEDLNNVEQVKEAIKNIKSASDELQRKIEKEKERIANL